MDDARDVAVPRPGAGGGIEHHEVPIDADGDVRARSGRRLRRRVERVGERGTGNARQEIAAIERVAHGDLLVAMPRFRGTQGQGQAEQASGMVTRPAPFRKSAVRGAGHRATPF